MKKILMRTVMVLGFSSLSLVALAQGDGADRQEGWIIQKTDKGIVKIPKRQIFIFDGSNISGKGLAPGQTILQKRPSRTRRSLIPERYSFRREGLDAVGFQER
ncbi:MAG TPA: hypothetical protein VM901_11790 [Bdellovibrionota bacterium]|nr:hypothetical protein [Bdellovibrionota bacterium]